MKKFLIFASLLVLILGLTATVRATPISFTNTLGDLSAKVTFDIDSTGNLIVTLENISTKDVQAPSDVLTGVFFSLSDPSIKLTGVSAVLGSGTVLFDQNVTNVGGEWAYKEGLSGVPLGADRGISSSGLGDLFGPKDRFSGENLQGPDSVGGIEYGITSSGDNSSTGNKAVTGTNALIQGSVVFTFNVSGLPEGFDLSNAITNVSFQYGTDLSEPNIPVPEPSTLLLLGVSLIGIGIYGRRKFGSRKSLTT